MYAILTHKRDMGDNCGVCAVIWASGDLFNKDVRASEMGVGVGVKDCFLIRQGIR